MITEKMSHGVQLMKRQIFEVLEQAEELQTGKSLKVQKVSMEPCESTLVTN